MVREKRICDNCGACKVGVLYPIRNGAMEVCLSCRMKLLAAE